MLKLFFVFLGAVQSLNIGADISDLQLYVDANAQFLDASGGKVDPLQFLISKGLNYARVRIFVNPKEDSETGQSTAYVSKLGKKIKDAGIKFLLDFHYSDSWADPGQQTKPSAWKSLSTSALIDEVYTYTKSTLQTLKSAGAVPDSIQIGNEITAGMLWNDGRVGVWSESYNTDAQWNNLFSMIKNGIKAAREIFPSAKIVIHSDRSGDQESASRFFKKFNDAKIDYDIIGLSYYPFWHGSLSTMTSTVSAMAALGKEVWIAEVAHPYNQYGVPNDASYTPPYAASPDGQAQFLAAFITALKGTKATSFFWWFPEETYSPSKRISPDLHRGLWSNQNGKALPAMDTLANGK